MDIFDSPYFSINKKLMCAMGLWPYDSRKNVMRTLWMIFCCMLVASCMLSVSASSFGLLPLIPEILNALYPLPVPRGRVYILIGEFFVENRDDHFWMIYVTESITIMSIVFICIAIDPMYTASVEHCSALYAIVTHRLSKLKHETLACNNSPQNISRDTSYDCVASAIKLHQIALSFTDNINESYSMCFLCLTVINLVDIPIICVLIMINKDDPVSCFRFGSAFVAIMVHVFVIFWPGQKLIDHSTRLLDDATCNEWYGTSARTKKILRIFMIRCTQPSLITAGGLVEMNFENYYMVVKTAASYITVLASFR